MPSNLSRKIQAQQRPLPRIASTSFNLQVCGASWWPVTEQKMWQNEWQTLNENPFRSVERKAFYYKHHKCDISWHFSTSLLIKHLTLFYNPKNLCLSFVPCCSTRWPPCISRWCLLDLDSSWLGRSRRSCPHWSHWWSGHLDKKKGRWHLLEKSL